MAKAKVWSSTVVFLFVLAVLAVPAPARAYLDPASGSLILQVLLGGIAGAALVLKLFWRKVLGFFGRNPSRKDESPR